MLIQCPNCEICYQIEKDILPEGGRKFRCAKCGQVWQARPEDAFEATDDVKIYGVHNEGATSASDSASASESTLEPDSSSESFQAEEGEQTQLSADTPEPVAEDAAADTLVIASVAPDKFEKSIFVSFLRTFTILLKPWELPASESDLTAPLNALMFSTPSLLIPLAVSVTFLSFLRVLRIPSNP